MSGKAWRGDQKYKIPICDGCGFSMRLHTYFGNAHCPISLSSREPQFSRKSDKAIPSTDCALPAVIFLVGAAVK